MSEADLTAPTSVDPPPIHDAAPPLTEPDAPTDDAADDVIEIPTGEKLVPLTALQKAREAEKAARRERDGLKAKADEAAAAQAERDRLAAELEAVRPRAAAYDAALQAQLQQPQAPAEPTAEETAELREIATLLDLYTAEGQPDLARAAKVQALNQRTAERVAGAQVAPIKQQSVQQQAIGMFQRALATTGEGGVKPDPAVLQDVWRRLDPNLTATPEGAVQAWNIALGMTYATGKAKPAAAKEALPPPLVTEKAGGQVGPGPSLRESDLRAARTLGMSEKEYAEALNDMPEGWGKAR